MGRAPNALERTVLALNAAPATLLDVNGAMALRALAPAVRLGLLDALAGGPRTPAQVARQLGLHEGACASWMGLLAASGYLRAGRGGYALSPSAAKWLRPGGHLDFSLFVRFWGEVVLPFWDAHLEEVLRKGRPPQTLYAWMDAHPGTWEVAQAWFLATARASAPEVVRRARLPQGTTRLLDLGGGHGYFSAAFCRAHPALKAELLDGPGALRTAAAVLEEEGMEGRVALREGDYLRAPLEPNHDVVLLFNVLHGHDDAEAEQVVRRAAGALRPGGKLLILEQLPERAPGPTFDAFLHGLDLNYRAVLGGKAYTWPELRRMLGGAGLADARRIPLRAPGNALVEGTRTTPA